jgi:hypothetical protein
MANLVWRVKLIAERGSGIVSETEVARIEGDDFAVAETVGPTASSRVLSIKCWHRINILEIRLF